MKTKYLIPFNDGIDEAYLLRDNPSISDYISGKIVFFNKKGTVNFIKDKMYIVCVDFDNDDVYCFRHYLKFIEDIPNFDVNPYKNADLHKILIMRIDDMSDSVKMSKPYIKFIEHQRREK